MVVLTLGNFRVDEFMETKMTLLAGGDLNQVKLAVQSSCEYYRSDNGFLSVATPIDVRHSKGHPAEPTAPYSAGESSTRNPAVTSALKEILADIDQYINEVINHPRICSAPEHSQFALRVDFFTFLTSHIDQLIANQLFCDSASKTSFRKSHLLHLVAQDARGTFRLRPVVSRISRRAPWGYANVHSTLQKCQSR